MRPEPITSSAPSVLTKRLLVAAGPLLFAACAGGAGGESSGPTAPANPTPPASPVAPPSVASVTVSPPSATLIAGDTVRLRATAWDAAGREIPGVTFTWASSDDAMARVTTSGLVTALTAGEARVSASVEGKQANAQLTATPRTFADATIAFVSFRHGTPEIYTLGPAGERRLTNNAVGEDYIEWSPDGNRIVFQAECSGAVPGCDRESRGIWIMRADGSGLTRLTRPGPAATGGDLRPQWSPIGDRIAYSHGTDKGSEIRVVNADGTGDVYVAGGSGTEASAPVWSPDGRQIAFFAYPSPPGPGTDKSDIYVVNTDGTGLKNLTNTPSVSDEKPRWSPDGRKIAFDVWLGGPQVHTMNPDGSGLVRLTTAQWSDRGSVWSPDGARIAFRSNRDRAGGDLDEIYVMNADGSAQTRLTTGRWYTWGTSWSPDGRRIAFSAQLERPGFTGYWDRWDVWHVYIINADGTGLVRLTGPGTSDYNPAWRP
jgi:Tol biopolymer transport system component